MGMMSRLLGLWRRATATPASKGVTSPTDFILAIRTEMDDGTKAKSKKERLAKDAEGLVNERLTDLPRCSLQTSTSYMVVHDIVRKRAICRVL